MKRLFALLLIVCFALPAFAQDKEDKIGTANMARLIGEYYKTKAMRKELSGYQAEVIEQREERVKTIRAAVEEAQKFQREAQAEGLSEEERSKFFQQATNKQKEAQSLDRDLRSWLQRRQSAMDEKMAMEMADISKEVLAIVRKVGDQEGFDYIFDRSGSSAVGVNILVYTKDATDLTGILLERINENAPKEDEEAKDAKGK